MSDVAYIRASTPEEALQQLASAPQGRVLAGGTDMVPLMKEGITQPEKLIDVTGWPDAAQIEEREGGLFIGPLATLSQIARNPLVHRSYTALADACRVAATPQLRNMSTIAGNLLQQTRCWYFRGPFDCWLKGGEKCFARKGENDYHSIFVVDPWISPCVSAHPSDAAAALLALDARITLRNAQGEREVPAQEFFARPTAERRSFVAMDDKTLITGIILPPPVPGARSVYRKAMSRATWSFALAGIALHLVADGDQITHARVAITGVSTIPLRIPAVEEALVKGAGPHVDMQRLGDLLVSDARPLEHNAYKVALLRALFSQVLRHLLR